MISMFFKNCQRSNENLNAMFCIKKCTSNNYLGVLISNFVTYIDANWITNVHVNIRLVWKYMQCLLICPIFVSIYCHYYFLLYRLGWLLKWAIVLYDTWVLPVISLPVVADCNYPGNIPGWPSQPLLVRWWHVFPITPW